MVNVQDIRSEQKLLCALLPKASRYCFCGCFFAQSSVRSFCSFVRLVCLLVCLFVCVLVCALVCFFVCSFVRLLSRWFVRLFVCPFARSLAGLLACLFACLLACLLARLCLVVCLSVCLFVCLFVCFLLVLWRKHDRFWFVFALFLFCWGLAPTGACVPSNLAQDLKNLMSRDVGEDAL